MPDEGMGGESRKVPSVGPFLSYSVGAAGNDLANGGREKEPGACEPGVASMMPKPGPVGQAFLRGARNAAATALIAMIASPPARAGVTAEQALAKARRLIAPPACGTAGDGNEIVVCARRTDLYRVPAEIEGGQVGDTRGRAGEVPSASPDRLAGGRCGIFAGERQCSKAEAKLYGYDSTLNPINVLLGLGKALIDPE